MYHSTYTLHRRKSLSTLIDRVDFQHYKGWITRKNKYRRLILVPGSTFKRFWELLGLLLLIHQLVSNWTLSPHHLRHSSSLELSCVHKWLPCSDTYFLIDLFVRMRSGYVDELGEIILDPDLVYGRYANGWLVFDVFTAFPYQLIWLIWKWSAALRLATVTNASDRALLSFLGDKDFRTNFVQSSRDHWRQWTTFEDMITSKSFKRSSLYQKSIHLIVNMFRTNQNLRALQRVKTIMAWLNNLSLSLRTLTVFSRTMETTFVETTKDDD